MYEYKVIPVPQYLAIKSGQNLGDAIAEFVENKITEMAHNGWEYYRADQFTATERLGCILALLGQTGKIESYNLLTFRRAK
jgi:hypothetical protein